MRCGSVEPVVIELRREVYFNHHVTVTWLNKQDKSCHKDNVTQGMGTKSMFGMQGMLWKVGDRKSGLESYHDVYFTRK
jgi:hypothetical protein